MTFYVRVRSFTRKVWNPDQVALSEDPYLYSTCHLNLYWRSRTSFKSDRLDPDTGWSGSARGFSRFNDRRPSYVTTRVPSGPGGPTEGCEGSQGVGAGTGEVPETPT